MNEAYEARRASERERVLKSVDFAHDLYGENSIFCIMNGHRTDEAMKQLLFTANWFEHPHPNGRDLRGEADFASIRMVHALFGCYDKLTDEVHAALENFFLNRDYSSIYGSENHSLMYRVSRLLAAQFYRGKTFTQYGLSAEEALREDEAYIDEFLMYRARRAWGEFDSLGYAAEIVLILNTLYMYTENARLKKKASMMLDMILLDMIVDTKDGIYGGAHGRIYEGSALNACWSNMYSYYCYYFGAEGGYPENLRVHTAALLSDYYPSEIVCRVAKNRKFPYENRERKHLHCCEAWVDGIHYEYTDAVEGLSIDKYLYLSDDYMLGSVVHQDAYPATIKSGWYAHHQQHEWELTLPGGDGRRKIFSHHPGDPGYHHTHNHWTGDIGCNCGTHFCTKDTAVSLYNIVKPQEMPYINADIPLDLFDERLLDRNYIFLRAGKIYIMVWFSNDYRFVTEGPTAGYEAVSDGRKHAFLCHVEPVSAYASLEVFAAAMKEKPIRFDADAMEFDFEGIHVDYAGNSVNGTVNRYPFPMLYDSPYLTSEYGSAVLHVTDGTESAVYDFNF